MYRFNNSHIKENIFSILNAPDFQNYFDKYFKHLGNYNFAVIGYYARTGPSWMASEKYKFSPHMTVIELLAYCYLRNWRKMNIIGEKEYIFIDRDNDSISYQNEEFKDPYELKIGD